MVILLFICFSHFSTVDVFFLLICRSSLHILMLILCSSVYLNISPELIVCLVIFSKVPLNF